jgi:hypothetical protein
MTPGSSELRAMGAQTCEAGDGFRSAARIALVVGAFMVIVAHLLPATERGAALFAGDRQQ